ncbi:MAG: hypothetical protein DA408_09570 [Bacteroidetes bacterium]|nr:MAG: hypothetical protein DA408_09570 [Bacteroidota bacterium]
MSVTRTHILFLLLVILLPLLLGGQPFTSTAASPSTTVPLAVELPRVRNFTPNDYHAANQNWMLAQAADGSIHAANSSGLVTFNGTYWQQRSLPGQKIVRAVATAHDGRIYVGAYNEFGYFTDSLADEGSYVSLSRQLPQEALGEEIWNIIVQDTAVIFHSFGAIYCYTGQQVAKILPPGVILNIIPVGHQLIVPVIDQGLYSWEPGQSFVLVAGTEKLIGKNVRGIIPVDRALLIATERSGIYWLRNGQLTPWQTPLFTALANEQINRFQQLHDGTIAVGTILGGLYLLHPDGTLLYHLDRSSGLQNNTVIGLLQDAAGDLWLGLDRGIDLVVLSDPLRYFTANQQAIGTVYAACIFQDRQYLGTNQGLFQRPLDGTLPYQLVAGTQGQVWELRIIDNQLLCGHNNGTYRIAQRRATLVSPVTGGWQLLLLHHPTRRLLQATYTGLICLDQQPDQSWAFSHRIEGLSAPLREIVRTDTFELLAAHAAEGLYRLRLAPDGRNYQQIELLGPAQGLPTGNVYHLTDFPEGVLVETGNQKWLYQQHRFFPIDSFRGERLLPAAQVQGAGPEAWIQATTSLLWRYQNNMPTRRLVVQLARDHPQVIALGNGTSLLCQDEGYALLNERNTPPPAPPPPVTINWKFYYHNQWRYLPPVTGSVRSAQENQLRFVFHQPLFAQPDRYRYQLQGFDADWSEWSTRYEKEYANLPAGDYVFRVAAQLSNTTAELSFSIRPPWYWSAWSLFIYTIIGLLTLRGLYQWHEWRLQRQARELELKRERQLHNERIQLRNEQLQADIIGKSKALANSTLNLVRKNEILLQLKQELKAATRRSLSERDHYKLQEMIDKHLTGEQDWEIFESNFNQVHEDFFKRLKIAYPELTPGDLKLAAYLRMNLSSKEIAPLLHISIRGVENKRYRLRKKTGLDADANLTGFFMDY